MTVLAHAIGDAILGALALGDLGKHFPGQRSCVARRFRAWRFSKSSADSRPAEGARIVNVDATLVAEAPKIAPHAEQMRANLAHALGIEPRRVSVKATTNEKLGAVGRGEGIAAMAVALVEVPRR